MFQTPIHLACAWKRLPVLTQLLAEFRVWYSAQPFAQQFPLDLDTQASQTNRSMTKSDDPTLKVNSSSLWIYFMDRDG
jgi:hypothetical protein